MTPLLEVRGLYRYFGGRSWRGRGGGEVKAVDGVDLEVLPGECLALVGESGSGKSTLARLVMRLDEPTGGEIRLAGEDLLALRGGPLRRRRRDFQMVFQDPHSSLNPRMRVGGALAEPLLVHRLVPDRVARAGRVAELLELVGLDPEVGERFPHQLSGGQRQRVGIARALATEPKLLVADEPVAALDVSVQAQILSLLAELRRSLRLSMLFIAHDLAVVEQLADRVAVMYLGRIVEIGPIAEVFARPRHPYTMELLSAVPVPDPGWPRPPRTTFVELPSASEIPPGCRYRPRCLRARDRCEQVDPQLERSGPGSGRAACHFPGELESTGATAGDEAGTDPSPKARR